MKAKPISIRLEQTILDLLQNRANEQHKCLTEIIQEILSKAVEKPQEVGSLPISYAHPTSQPLEAQTQFPFDKEAIKSYYKQKAIDLARKEGLIERQEILQKARTERLVNEVRLAEAKSRDKFELWDRERYRTKIAREA